MSIMNRVKSNKKTKTAPTTKTMILNGQEVTVTCHPEGGRRPKGQMRARGAQVNDMRLTSHMSHEDISDYQRRQVKKAS